VKNQRGGAPGELYFVRNLEQLLGGGYVEEEDEEPTDYNPEDEEASDDEADEEEAEKDKKDKERRREQDQKDQIVFVKPGGPV
jgi:hypothetical protein